MIYLIAIAQVGVIAAVWFIRPRVYIVHEPAKRYPMVYIPVQCGLPKSVGGVTDTCVRRRGHATGCLTESEVEHAAEVGAETQVVPAVPESSGPVDVADLGRHIKDCPTTLLKPDRLSSSESAWLHKTKVMVEDMVERSHFTEWESTRG